MSECADLTCYQKNRDVILNGAKDNYEKNKEILREQARYKYRNLSEEEKKLKKENMEKTDIAICLKKKKILKESQKNILRGKKVSI